MSCPEYTYGDLAPIGDQNLLQLHDSGVGTHSLVHSMLLARVPCIEELGVLVILVPGHGG
jgi:hypothetical protein